MCQTLQTRALTQDNIVPQLLLLILNEMRAMRQDMNDGFARLEARMDNRFDRLEAKLDEGFCKLDAHVSSAETRVINYRS